MTVVLYVAGMAVFWLLLMVAVVAFFAGCQRVRDQQVKAALAEYNRRARERAGQW